MASQYTEDSTENSTITPVLSTSNSFRRSLGTTTLFNRRLSRPIPNTTNSNSSTRPTSNTSVISNSNEDGSDPNKTIHIRIVPSIENPSRSLVFNIIERDLEAGRVIKIGRFTDRSSIQNHISFKSKVVSRSHCEIWLSDEGKVQLKDTRSSSGTFVNHVRLSPATTESRPVEIRDGDLVQLGVDYQGGYEEIYRSVKMRFEVNRPVQCRRPESYSMSAFNKLRNLTNIVPSQVAIDHQQLISSSSPLCHNNENNDFEIEECCICLYALAPFQALFVAPCSHSYHFKCIRPLFDSYPGFQCPICRTYSDLDSSVSIEAREVIEKFGLLKESVSHCNGLSSQPGECIQVEEGRDVISENNGGRIHNLNELSVPSSAVRPTTVVLSSITPPAPELLLSTTLVACTTSLSGIISSPSQGNLFERVTRDLSNNDAGDHRSTITFDDDNVIPANGYRQSTRQKQQTFASPASSSRNSNNNLVEKIRMAFSSSERRKSISKRQTGSSDTSGDEELSENYFDMPCSSTYSPSSSPRNNNNTLLQPVLSRQSTQYNALTEILEEPIFSENTNSRH